jgi:hypothetical protein
MSRDTKPKLFNFSQQTPKYIPAPFSMGVPAVRVKQGIKKGCKVEEYSVAAKNSS